MPPPPRKKTTKAERDRIQKRSADRKRQRAAKAKGEGTTSAQAIRDKRLRTPLEDDGREIPRESAEVEQFIALIRRHEEWRAARGMGTTENRLRLLRRFLEVLLARVRQMSPL